MSMFSRGRLVLLTLHRNTRTSFDVLELLGGNATIVTPSEARVALCGCVRIAVLVVTGRRGLACCLKGTGWNGASTLC